MRYIFILFFFYSIGAYAQSKYILPSADTTVIKHFNGIGDELVLENDTRDTANGVLTNVINGRTQFKKLRLQKINDTSFVLKVGTVNMSDTIRIPVSMDGGSGATYTLTKNAGLDSIILTGSNATRYAVKDSIGTGDTLPETTRYRFFAFMLETNPGDTIELIGIQNKVSGDFDLAVFRTESGLVFWYGNIYHDTEANYYLTANPTVMVYDSVFKTFQVFNDEIVRGFAYCPIAVTQTSTNAPVVTEYRTVSDGLESIVWTRNAQGEYYGTLAGAFVNNVLPLHIKLYSAAVEIGSATLSKVSNNVIAIRSYDLAGALQDDLLTNATFEIKVLY